MYKRKNTMNLHHIFLAILSISMPISILYALEHKGKEEELDWQQTLNQMHDAIHESDYLALLEEKRNTPPPSEFVVTCRKVGLAVLLQVVAFKRLIQRALVTCKTYLSPGINHGRE
jgi:hypothetical protein